MAVVGRIVKTEHLYILSWILLNVFTAVNTELYADEAYYWMYSQFPDWGYFDHPPAVAILIKLTSFLGHSELAVRLGSISLLSAAIWITYKLADVNPHLYFISVFSIFSLNTIGFVALPDIPFFFFGVLFLLAYKNYLQEPTLKWSLWLGILGALLLYSKYHGILIIGFTLLSNLSLLKRPSTYLTGIIILVLFMPHLWWQYEHHFPSYHYHAFERSSHTYSTRFIFDYLIENLFFHGPVALLFLLPLIVVRKTSDRWHKALKWNVYGTLFFFLVMSFKGRVEANWVIFVIFPLLVLGLKEMSNRPTLQQWYLYISCGIIFIFSVYRVHLIHPLIEVKKDRVWEFHGNKAFADTVFALAENRPVTANTYQVASILSFYAPMQPRYVPSLNVNSRSNQYSIWQLDSTMLGEEVLFVNRHITLGKKTTVKGIMNDSIHVYTIPKLPRTTGYAISCDDIIIKEHGISFLLHITRPKRELSKNDKQRIDIHIKGRDGTMRYGGMPIPHENERIRIGINPDDQMVTILLHSQIMCSNVRALQKIKLK